MKKFKKLFVLLVCLLCTCTAFAFAGCNKNDAKYIKDSFTYSISDYSVSSYEIEGEFMFKAPSAGRYRVTYILTTTGPCGKQQKMNSNTLTVKNKGATQFTVGDYFRKIDGKTNESAKISNIKIIFENTIYDYKPLAIGFGVVGGVILVGITVLFIVLKRRHN